MAFSTKKIEDFCRTGSGGTPSRSKPEYFDGGTIPWVKSGELKTRFVSSTEESITDAAVEQSAAKLVPKGALLIAMYGATVGEVSELAVDATTNQAICHIVPDPNLCDRGYLYQYLTAIKPELLDRRVGGGQPNISQSIIKSLSVPLPPLPEQRRIAAILDKADALRAKRREAITKLDQLLQSVFLEMFGDPVKNPKGWPTTSFEDVVYFQEGPGVRNWQFRESGIKLINVINLVDGELNLGRSWRHLDPEEVDSKYKHFLLDAGDLVVASSGVTWGKVAEVKESHLPLCLNTSVIRMRSVSQKLTKSYLRAFIEGQGFQGQIERLITGSAQPNFGPSHLKKLKIVLPPLGIQERFEHAASQICAMEERLACQQASLKCLFEALQQKVFQIAD